jgi:hypothetical protein
MQPATIETPKDEEGKPVSLQTRAFDARADPPSLLVAIILVILVTLLGWGAYVMTGGRPSGETVTRLRGLFEVFAPFRDPALERVQSRRIWVGATLVFLLFGALTMLWGIRPLVREGLPYTFLLHAGLTPFEGILRLLMALTGVLLLGCAAWPLRTLVPAVVAAWRDRPGTSTARNGQVGPFSPATIRIAGFTLLFLIVAMVISADTFAGDRQSLWWILTTPPDAGLSLLLGGVLVAVCLFMIETNLDAIRAQSQLAPAPVGRNVPSKEDGRVATSPRGTCDEALPPGSDSTGSVPADDSGAGGVDIAKVLSDRIGTWWTALADNKDETSTGAPRQRLALLDWLAKTRTGPLLPLVQALFAVAALVVLLCGAFPQNYLVREIVWAVLYLAGLALFLRRRYPTPAQEPPRLRAAKVGIAVTTRLLLILIGVLGLMTKLIPSAHRWLRSMRGSELRDLVFFYERTASLTSGVSIAVPLILLTVGYVTIIYFSLRGLAMRDAFKVRDHLKKWRETFIGGADRELQKRMDSILPLRAPGNAFVMIAFGLEFLIVQDKLVRPFEIPWFITFIFTVFSIYYLLLLYAFLHIHSLAAIFDRALASISLHPIRHAVQRLPRYMPDGEWIPEQVVEKSDELLRALKSKSHDRIVEKSDGLSEACDAIMKRLIEDWKEQPPNRVVVSLTGKTSNETQEGRDEDGSADEPAKQPSEPEPTALDPEEDLIALQLMHFVKHIKALLHCYMANVTAGALIMIAISMSYPFEYQNAMAVDVWIGVVLMTVPTIYLQVKLSRNRTLSWMEGTKPGEVTLDRSFLGGVGIHGAIPLLGLLAAHYPSIGKLYGVLDPFLRAIGE